MSRMFYVSVPTPRNGIYRGVNKCPIPTVPILFYNTIITPLTWYWWYFYLETLSYCSYYCDIEYWPGITFVEFSKKISNTVANFNPSIHAFEKKTFFIIFHFAISAKVSSINTQKASKLYSITGISWNH